MEQQSNSLSFSTKCHAFRLIGQIDADISEQVRDYLERHPGVLALLPEVAQQVDGYFSADATHRLRLEVLEDTDADQSELFVVVESSLDTEMATQCLDRLLEDWFVDQAMVRAGRLAIVTEPLSAKASNDKLERTVGSWLDSLRRQRVKADYEADFNPRGAGKRALNEARKILAKLSQCKG